MPDGAEGSCRVRLVFHYKQANTFTLSTVKNIDYSRFKATIATSPFGHVALNKSKEALNTESLFITENSRR